MDVYFPYIWNVYIFIDSSDIKVKLFFKTVEMCNALHNKC